ncbi:Fe-S-containing hydro-lyase [Pelotomaculum terephthalicicum JT]|uniref:Fe-S-containing hydro-lyase n=1 Tax=Pelotomaculum TaxID=191373 RepID=UPI0009C72569|nr:MULTISPECIES: Fe-S-containing hydro-lyase [Pelotomaculum]MCG9966560.1 Fe-S-containing hydro-lyase [Pelotomaculum terephthalicicum JT]OPX91229.1 MAG: Fumarate hydratase class I, aerobic [Pelotomaculum sp. PtaB.Bin117]OPY63497.1 MAG: Fumarate hydratase class I, aerobic [Pelotomaculum sp. PtaU1.Bin065]
MDRISLTTPLSGNVVENLRSGQRVSLNGIIYTGRDAAHKRLVEYIEQGKKLPFDLEGQVIYYVGPSPARPGMVIGAAGPTTSGRMDLYAPKLYALGLKATIGKGRRSPDVIRAMRKYKGIYLAAVGGAAALIARSIKEARVIAYPELGPEAVHELLVEDFPAIVINDTLGGDLYDESIKLYSEHREDGRI